MIPRIGVVLLALLSCIPAGAEQIPNFWMSFDPHKPEMTVFEKKEWTDGGTALQSFYYLSETWKGQPVKVFAYYGRPADGKNLPAVLHVHGGGQTASLADVMYWARDGYAVLSFDWTGPRKGREKVTVWPEGLNNHYTVDPDPTYSKLYHALVAARRGLTFLEERPEVDRSRIGIYGVSWGGFLTWILNGTDDRIKAAVPVYGCGGTMEDGHQGAAHLKILGKERAEKWTRSFDPAAYVAFQKSPLLFLNPTNDFFGWLDVTVRRMRALKCENRLALTPNTNHHLSRDIAENVKLWMDTHLRGGPAWPRTPNVTVSLRADGVPVASPDADTSQEIAECRIYYALGRKYSSQRFWKFAGSLTDPAGCVPLEICDTNASLGVFCTVRYKRGMAISSIPIEIDPGSLGPVKATGKWSSVIDDFSHGIDDWHTGMSMGGVNITPGLGRLVLDEDGPAGGKAISVSSFDPQRTVMPFEISTRKVADPRWNGGGSKALSFYVKSDGKVVLRIQLIENAQTILQKILKCDCGMITREGWQRIVLSRDKFKDNRGNPPAGFRDVTLLKFIGRCSADRPVSIGLVEWVK